MESYVLENVSAANTTRPAIDTVEPVSDGMQKDPLGEQLVLVPDNVSSGQPECRECPKNNGNCKIFICNFLGICILNPRASVTTEQEVPSIELG